MTNVAAARTAAAAVAVAAARAHAVTVWGSWVHGYGWATAMFGSDRTRPVSVAQLHMPVAQAYIPAAYLHMAFGQVNGPAMKQGRILPMSREDPTLCAWGA
ncbi:hypothetical protein [Kocuria sp. ZOR0020]|uniref:hypothetical protein n=1 Tax=Kocuria sp. ZOR0020 TaxID=1339234 RepID=UPI0012E081D2|nr:hypothetical protein [Kocuria sp. ZOR0020]